jgi:thioredoxin 1
MRGFMCNLLAVSAILPSACSNSGGPDAGSGGPDARITVTAASHDSLIKESTKPVVLEFWAPWCGPCKLLDPVLAKISVQNTNVVIGKVNVDEEARLAQRYNVNAIPALIVIVGGKVTKTSVGFMEKSGVEKFLDEAVKGDQKRGNR